MKKTFKFILPLIAVIITVAGVWAMRTTKHVSQNQPPTEYYYHYSGDQATLAAYQNQENWEQIQDKNQPGCGNSGSLPCVVKSQQSSLQAFVSSIQSTGDVENHEYSTRNP